MSNTLLCSIYLLFSAFCCCGLVQPVCLALHTLDDWFDKKRIDFCTLLRFGLSTLLLLPRRKIPQWSISSTFWEQLLSVQILKAQKSQSSCQSFLRFWDLRAQKLLVERWWNLPLCFALPYSTPAVSNRISLLATFVATGIHK